MHHFFQEELSIILMGRKGLYVCRIELASHN